MTLFFSFGLKVKGGVTLRFNSNSTQPQLWYFRTGVALFSAGLLYTYYTSYTIFTSIFYFCTGVDTSTPPSIRSSTHFATGCHCHRPPPHRHRLIHRHHREDVGQVRLECWRLQKLELKTFSASLLSTTEKPFISQNWIVSLFEYLNPASVIQ